MPTKKIKPITKKGLEAQVNWANEAMQLLLDYRNEVAQFIIAIESATTPPGPNPPNPPGIPKAPKM